MINKELNLFYNPYGISDFENLKAHNYPIIDKTGFIAFLERRNSTSYPILLRPRRFGKSTFVKTLKCFYDISYKDRYDELFKGTKIHELNLASHNTYHVLDFDFSMVSSYSQDTLLRSLLNQILNAIDDFSARYTDFVFIPTELQLNSPADLISCFFLLSENTLIQNHYI